MIYLFLVWIIIIFSIQKVYETTNSIPVHGIFPLLLLFVQGKGAGFSGGETSDGREDRSTKLRSDQYDYIQRFISSDSSWVVYK